VHPKGAIDDGKLGVRAQVNKAHADHSRNSCGQQPQGALAACRAKLETQLQNGLRGVNPITLLSRMLGFSAKQRLWPPMSGIFRKLIGLLLILTAVAIAWNRYDDRPVETLVGRWAQPPSEFIEVNGQIVHIRDEGPANDPTPLVLIHGTGASLHTWDGWVEALKTHRRVVRFDLPGFGLTGPFAGSYANSEYRGDNYARFVLDVLGHLKIERAVLGGNSLGGEVAWRTAVMAPQRVDKLVLVDASGPLFHPEEIPPGFLLARLPVFSWLSQYLLPRSLVTATLHSVYGDDSKVSDALVDRYFEIALREGNRHALTQRLKLLKDDLAPERLSQVRQPTLILWGEKDRLIPPATAQVFAKAIQGSRVNMLPGLGHVPHEEDPAASVAPVLLFLQTP
jgi:pimeloyl-ACP methyl ester carboxylesterase